MIAPAALCRFLCAAFTPKSSYLHAPRGRRCEGALANPARRHEGDALHAPLPSASGGCPNGSVPACRLNENGQGRALNHCFTTTEQTWLGMLRDGCTAEGAGVGVGMCSPQSRTGGSRGRITRCRRSASQAVVGMASRSRESTGARSWQGPGLPARGNTRPEVPL
jgi:hypothetical protein